MTTHLDLRDEDGWVLVTAVICLALMLTITLASFSLVDTGQTRSREQRERETSLNVAEGALYSQGFTLAQRWPGNSGGAPNVPAMLHAERAPTRCARRPARSPPPTRRRPPRRASRTSTRVAGRRG